MEDKNKKTETISIKQTKEVIKTENEKIMERLEYFNRINFKNDERDS